MLDASADTPQPKFRKDYRRPDYSIDSVDLRFELGEDATIVHATLAVRRTDGAAGAPLVLDGEALKTLSIAIDGRTLAQGEYSLTPTSLTIPDPGERFELRTVVEIQPQKEQPK